VNIGIIRLSFIASCFVCLFSCVNTKKLNVVWVLKKQNIYETISDSNGHFSIVKDSIIEPLIAKLIKRDSFLFVKVYEGKFSKDTLGKAKFEPVPQGLFFPYVDHLDPGSSTFAASRKLVYISASPVFQALTIPVKVRLETNGYPYESEASINLGIAYGWKFTHNVYHNYYHRKTGDFVNSSENRYSITPGIFAGPGIVELTARNSISPNDRNVLALSYGAMLVFGINRLNVGLALGFDDAVGNGDKNWIYQNKAWIGTTISFDLIQ
jgi:hypothetical protein